MRREMIGRYRTMSYFLRGLGVFCVIYPILVKVLAPERVFSGRHLAFFIAGLVFLVGAGILNRVGRTR